MLKKVIKIAVAFFVLVLILVAVGVALFSGHGHEKFRNCKNNFQNYSPQVVAIANEFNLNVDEVQRVFDENNFRRNGRGEFKNEGFKRNNFNRKMDSQKSCSGKNMMDLNQVNFNQRENNNYPYSQSTYKKMNLNNGNGGFYEIKIPSLNQVKMNQNVQNQSGRVQIRINGVPVGNGQFGNNKMEMENNQFGF